MVNEDEQELTTQASEPEVKVEEEVTNTPDDVVETTQVPLVVEEDLVNIKLLYFLLKLEILLKKTSFHFHTSH